jgi:small conductance mechanosensitive channel
VEFEQAWQTIQGMIKGTFATLPKLIPAILIFLAFYIIGKRTKLIVRALTDKQHKARNAGMILGKLAQSAVMTAGVLVVLTILFPSFEPGNLIQLLGIGSVAIGFAFHDVFQNFLAGILLLLTGPFRVGDEISVDHYEGTVEDIQTRATTLRTHDGERVVIPNSDLFTNSVTVHTALRMRRIQYELAIDYDEDIRQVKRVLQEALNTIENVETEPAAEVLVSGLADGSILLHILCWTRLLHQIQILRLQDSILTTTKEALVANNIQISMPTQKILLENIHAGKNGASEEKTLATDAPNVS